MPNFTISTDNSHEPKSAREKMHFPDTKAATNDAQVALGEMVRDILPNGEHANLGVQVEDEAGKQGYRATLNFEAVNEADIEREDADADAAADTVAACLGIAGSRS